MKTASFATEMILVLLGGAPPQHQAKEGCSQMPKILSERSEAFHLYSDQD